MIKVESQVESQVESWIDPCLGNGTESAIFEEEGLNQPMELSAGSKACASQCKSICMIPVHIPHACTIVVHLPQAAFDVGLESC